MKELVFESATKLAGLVRSRQVSPVELVEAHIRRIEEVNPRLNAYVSTAFERARDLARASEYELMRGKAAGLLHGVPVSVKDTIETAGLRTVAGTRLRESYVPATDAPAVARLKRAGAIVLGKTNVPECAMDYRAENPVFGATSNPWDLGRVPGGSSGGEAAAIAAGCSAGGLGSDLGGSIRVPAHFCGIVGLKGTPGRIPVSGHFPPCIGPFALGASIGPLARRVEDLMLWLRVLAGFDSGDPVSVPLPASELDPAVAQGLQVMWYADDGITPVTAATKSTVRHAAQALARRGLKLEERRPAGLERTFELWYTWLAEAGLPSILELYQGKEELMGPLIRALAPQVRPLGLQQYVSIWFERDLLRTSVINEMARYPVILAPVAAVPAFGHGHRGGFRVNGQEIEYPKAFSYCQAYNLLGLPAAVVPCGRSPEGLPIGVQVVGRPWEEETVLAVAALLEQELGGYQRPPL